jgi:hypothetical protein
LYATAGAVPASYKYNNAAPNGIQRFLKQLHCNQCLGLFWSLFMASSSSTTVAALLSQPVAEKLTRSNHTIWKAQVLATLRGAQMAGYLDGTIKEPEEFLPHDKDAEVKENPEYIQWLTQNQDESCLEGDEYAIKPETHLILNS